MLHTHFYCSASSRDLLDVFEPIENSYKSHKPSLRPIDFSDVYMCNASQTVKFIYLFNSSTAIYGKGYTLKTMIPVYMKQFPIIIEVSHRILWMTSLHTQMG